MARPESTVSGHPSQMLIDIALLEGVETITAIANKHGFTRQTLSGYLHSVGYQEKKARGFAMILEEWMDRFKDEARDSAERIERAKSSTRLASPPERVLRKVVETCTNCEKNATAIATDSTLSLQDRIKLLMDNAEGVLSSAEGGGMKQGELRLKAIKELRETIKLLAQLNGELNTGNNIQINIDKQIGDTSETIINSLEPFPEAKEHVVVTLSKMMYKS